MADFIIQIERVQIPARPSTLSESGVHTSVLTKRISIRIVRILSRLVLEHRSIYMITTLVGHLSPACPF